MKSTTSHIFLVAFCFLMTPAGIFAKSTRRVLSSYWVNTKTLREAEFLEGSFAVERQRGNRRQVIVPEAEADRFLKMFPDAQLDEKDIHDVFVRNTRRNPRWRDRYHNWNSVQAELTSIAGMNPSLASVEHYGQSDNGEPLTAFRLTGRTTDIRKPEVLITSSTHGNEIATVEITMGMIQRLIAGYGKDTRITAMMDKHVIFFIPVVSPDGYLDESREVNGVDPNRDYPYPGNPNKHSIPTIENETKWFAIHNIEGSCDIHSPAEMVMYPWAYTAQSVPAADLAKFKALVNPMGQDLGFPVGQIYHIIYPAPGSSADYWYWKHKTLALGYEMAGGSFAPDSSEIPALIEQHVPSLYHFVEYFQ